MASSFQAPSRPFGFDVTTIRMNQERMGGDMLGTKKKKKKKGVLQTLTSFLVI